MLSENVYLPLPNSITNQFTTYESREQFVVKYLEKTLPSTDSKEVLEELKRVSEKKKKISDKNNTDLNWFNQPLLISWLQNFILDKHKLRRKPQDSDKTKGKSYLKRRFAGLKRIGRKHGLLYRDLMPLNHMWLAYIAQTLGVKDFSKLPTSPVDPHWETIGQRLLKADYHGAAISVVRCKNPGAVGTSGIILQETKNCFNVITPDDRLKGKYAATDIFLSYAYTADS